MKHGVPQGSDIGPYIYNKSIFAGQTLKCPIYVENTNIF